MKNISYKTARVVLIRNTDINDSSIRDTKMSVYITSDYFIFDCIIII